MTLPPFEVMIQILQTALLAGIWTILAFILKELKKR